MSYTYTLERLLELLNPYEPVKVASVLSMRRAVPTGLLSVGLKIHFLGRDWRAFSSLIEGLGGRKRVLEENYYKREQASFCLVLPPVGNANSAISLLECIGSATKCPMFDNPEVELQVCSPGRLSNEGAALLTICFHLGSDLLREYESKKLETTFSDDGCYPRGRRLALYDAGYGMFDEDFDYWHKHNGRLQIAIRLPFKKERSRTDVIFVKCRRDILNINLVATLLVHAQYSGFWQQLGLRFVREMKALLAAHELSGLLAAPWIYRNHARPDDDERFIEALRELSFCALLEEHRLKVSGERNGVLQEVQMKLFRFRRTMEVVAARALKGEVV